MGNRKINQGVLWNICSYFFLGIFTIIIYMVIVYRYGQTQLGSYNIVLSFYMLLGQIGSWGLQSTTIYYVPKINGERKELSSCFVSFVAISFGVGMILGIVIYLLADVIGNALFHGSYVCIGLKSIAPAIVLFSMNKVICSFINGLNRMRMFAVLQTIRYAMITICVGLVVVRNLSFERIFSAFMIAEVTVLFFAIGVLVPYIKVTIPRKSYLMKGFCFGAKAMFGNVVGDINTRIDTMMLGVFCGENAVGLYSFITVISEGFMSLLYVFRNNFNPVFSSFLHEKQLEQVEKEYHNLTKKLPVFFASVACLVMIAYMVFCILFLDSAYMRSVHATIYIVVSYIIMAPYFACGNLCTLKGYPLVDTLVMVGTVACNALFNIIFIQLFDIVGAAIATAAANILYAVVMKLCTRRYVFRNIRN